MAPTHRPPARSLTDYITLGRSGLRVSPMCLGTMTFGEEVKWGADVKTSETVLDTYLERGGNFLDTANIYNRGHSEKIIGDYFARSPGKRERVVIGTKFFGNMYPGDPNGGGAGRKSLMHACHESLRRLQTDYIDMYWLHFWDFHTPIEETMRTLDDLVRAGKVRYIGLSDTPAWKVAQAQTMAQLRSWTQLSAIQIEYSLIERTVEAELVPMADEMGLSIVAWSPLKSGLLSGKHTRTSVAANKPDRPDAERALSERNFTIIDTLIEVAKEAGTTPSRVALSWLLNRPGNVIPIVGARDAEQLVQNLDSLGVSLNAEQVKRLDAISAPQRSFIQLMRLMGPAMMHGNMSVNGFTAPEFKDWLKPGGKIY